MNTSQRITLALGFIVVAGFGAYVPWDMEIEHVVEVSPGESDRQVLVAERQQGYSFVWDVPDSKAEGHYWGNYSHQTVNIDYEKILLSWVVAASVTAAVVLLLGLTQSPRTETPDSADNDKMDETS